MTPQEVIKTLEVAKAEVEWNYPMDYAVAIDEAIKAVGKQEKIKEAFTHYAFNGYEMDVLKDYIHCLAEIKDILNWSEEE